MISNKVKEEILSRVDILDIVGEVVELKRRGTNYLGLCPFHNEKTPSFTVSPSKNIYKCFGCGKAGNAITFLKDYHGFSFQESLKVLAQRYGIRVQEETEETKKELSRQELAYKALTYAAEFYNDQLNSNAGTSAMSYFNKRKFTPETIKKFQLGFSLDQWNTLMEYLYKQGFNEQSLVDAGLLIINEDNNSRYDRFRGRVMFPIHNDIGKVIGFGARDISGAKDVPKYLNSPQSLVYDKSYTVYGIFQAKNEIRSKKSIILTEGYADVITLHQAGFNNAVASSGTALTDKQLQLLTRFGNILYISYDSDAAGKKAADKAIELALKFGFDVRVVVLPLGEDPDSIISNHGAGLYAKYLQDAVSFIDFKYDFAKSQNLLESPKQKSDFIKSMVGLISSINDRMQHDFFISELAHKLSLSESQVRDIYAKKSNNEAEVIHKKSEYEYPEEFGELPYLEEEFHEEVKEDVIILPEEALLFRLMLNEKKVLTYCEKKLKFSSEHFFTDSAKVLFSIIKNLADETDNLILGLTLKEDEIERRFLDCLLDIVMRKEVISENWRKFGADDLSIDLKRSINDSIIKIEIRKLEMQIEEIKSIQIEEPNIDIERLLKLTELNQKRIKLKDALNFQNY